MTTETKTDPQTPAPPADDETPEEEPVAAAIGQWEWINEDPTPEQVRDVLLRLDPKWGVTTADYADYIVPLSQNKTIKRDGVEVKVVSTTLYMSVAGRIAMINEAAERNDWRVDFQPDPNTPTGVHGYLVNDGDRIVYREYVSVYERDKGTGQFVPIGTRGGTAWVPSTGGGAAVGSNRYEVVETSARGRAIAAWGLGVLPGSGVASLDEMQAAVANARGGRQRGGTPREAAASMSRDEMLEQVLGKAEQVRQARGDEPEAMTTKLSAYLTKIGVKPAHAKEGYTAEDGTAVVSEIDWSVVNKGQLQLVLNELANTLVKIEADRSNV